ncbi:MAG TPA: hypothetical protein VFC29_20670, partial [Candidatus Limnocylindrales bacterium]|nr:hypothetical protein [Candidatus Limnocylindrales bacterium]
MTKLWIEWKTNGRFPTRSIVPWKSRKGGEIPTFPQLRRLFRHAQKTGEQKTEAQGRCLLNIPSPPMLPTPNSEEAKNPIWAQEFRV